MSVSGITWARQPVNASNAVINIINIINIIIIIIIIFICSATADQRTSLFAFGLQRRETFCAANELGPRAVGRRYARFNLLRERERDPAERERERERPPAQVGIWGSRC